MQRVCAYITIGSGAAMVNVQKHGANLNFLPSCLKQIAEVPPTLGIRYMRCWDLCGMTLPNRFHTLSIILCSLKQFILSTPKGQSRTETSLFCRMCECLRGNLTIYRHGFQIGGRPRPRALFATLFRASSAFIKLRLIKNPILIPTE